MPYGSQCSCHYCVHFSVTAQRTALKEQYFFSRSVEKYDCHKCRYQPSPMLWAVAWDYGCLKLTCFPENWARDSNLRDLRTSKPLASQTYPQILPSTHCFVDILDIHYSSLIELVFQRDPPSLTFVPEGFNSSFHLRRQKKNENHIIGETPMARALDLFVILWKFLIHYL